MKIEKVHNDIRYTFSNIGLRIGDRVYPIASGRELDDGDWILHNFNFDENISGFPEDPHIIKEFQEDNNGTITIKTNNGYSNAQCYYKIIKMERSVEIPSILFKRFEWEVLDLFEMENLNNINKMK